MTPQQPIIAYDQRWDWNLKEQLFDYFRSIEAILIVLFYSEREPNKDAIFLWLYKLTPIWFEANFLEHFFLLLETKVVQSSSQWHAF